ncbi:MAG: NAD(P)/FAD-dependent oxidoreductase [Hyphomicrobium sp.]
MTKRTAVIGAGMAGLACARAMRRAGFFVEVFEQDRIIGGRIATARVGSDAYDHGAQYVTARTAQFRAYLDEIAALGYASRWSPRATLNGAEGAGQMMPWMVGTPGMASLMRPLAESVRVHTGRRVHTLERRDKNWHVWFEDETSAGPFQAVAVAVPATQAQLLLGRIDELVQPLSRVRMSPCWALMVRLEEKTLPDQDVYSDMSDVVRWIARNNTKPGRKSEGDSVVIHASPTWSRETEDADPEAVAEELWGEVSHLLALPPVRPVRMTAHLWRHGLVDSSLGETYLYSSEHKAGIAGDWCLGRLAEHAFESGDRLGKAIIGSLN